MAETPCIEHAVRLVGVEDRLLATEREQQEQRGLLRDLRSSSRATLVAAIATPLGAVAVAVIAGWFALQQTREQGARQASEAARQEVVSEHLELSAEQLRQSYALGRGDGHAAGRTEALAEVMEAQRLAAAKRVASKRGKR